MEVRVGTDYSAMDIAKYAVNRRYEMEKPISNLQLQKILYFLQLVFASKTRVLLFSDPFEAWPYGPVVRDVYNEFADYGGFPIRQGFSVAIEEDDLRSFLNAGIDLLAEKSPWELVSISHADGSPWDIVYNHNGRRKGIIPNELILESAGWGRDE